MKKYKIMPVRLMNIVTFFALSFGQLGVYSNILESTSTHKMKNKLDQRNEEVDTEKNDKKKVKKIKKRKKPNFLFIIVDEQRYPTLYETPKLKAWRKKNLCFQNWIAKKGYVFNNHYTNTNACCPARATIQTGQYPAVHGVTQTDGIAKHADDPEMTWLEPFTVPTMGNYLTEHGYRTVLKGKWHISNSAIKLNDGSDLITYDALGNPIRKFYDFYLEKNPLKDYGYNGWIGPEPHGKAPLNSAASVYPVQKGRDVKYAEELIQELKALSKIDKPWFLCASFVDPHDIAVYGLYAKLGDLFGTGWYFPIDPTLDPAVLPNLFTEEFFNTSFVENLSTKPVVQTQYRDGFAQFLQPIPDFDAYMRYYFTRMKSVDELLVQVYEEVRKLRLDDNLIIFFVSDHGELLDSHGKMHQKWYQAYQEAIKVPLIINSKLFGQEHHEIDDLTSHIDLITTVLEMAQAKTEVLRKKLGKNFSLNLPLPGRSLYPFIKNPNQSREEVPMYFYTEDNPTEGPHNQNAVCQTFEAMQEPASVEAVLLHIDGQLWKITHYYSVQGICSYELPGPYYEIYNVTQDPMELNNLFNNPAYTNIQDQLINALIKQAVVYRNVDTQILTLPSIN